MGGQRGLAGQDQPEVVLQATGNRIIERKVQYSWCCCLLNLAALVGVAVDLRLRNLDRRRRLYNALASRLCELQSVCRRSPRRDQNKQDRVPEARTATAAAQNSRG